MAKSVDLDEFFKEQQERLNISDSDWDQYEERVYSDRKWVHMALAAFIGSNIGE